MLKKPFCANDITTFLVDRASNGGAESHRICGGAYCSRLLSLSAARTRGGNKIASARITKAKECAGAAGKWERRADRICTSHREGNGTSELDNGLVRSLLSDSHSLARAEDKACFNKLSNDLGLHFWFYSSEDLLVTGGEVKTVLKVPPPGG